MPDYGKILAYRSPGGFGIRLDGGMGYAGAVITPFYDSLLVKVTASGQTYRDGAAPHGPRAARVPHPRREDQHSVPRKRHRTTEQFRSGQATTTLIDTTPELFAFKPRRDRATKLLNFLGNVIVNGNPHAKGYQPAKAVRRRAASRATIDQQPPPPEGTRQLLLEARARRNSPSGRSSKSACSSPTPPSATRTSRSWPRACAPTTCWPWPTPSRAARRSLFSLEMWGGATFDTAMRFLSEDPWERLRQLRAARAEHLLPDALPRLERRRLLELSGQRRRRFREARGRERAWIFSASSIR